MHHKGVVNKGKLNGNDQFIYSGISSITSSSFNVIGPADTTAGFNYPGYTYVGYLFGSDDTNIKCDTFTGGATVTCGFQPGWVLAKRTDSTGDWEIVDSQRGNNALKPNSLDPEAAATVVTGLTATGFTTTGTGDYMYIAIKDGAVAPGSVPSGVVASTDASAKTMTLRSSSGTWSVNTGNWVIGPEKTVAGTKLYTVVDNAGAVSDLQSTDPGFVSQTGTPVSLTFPATFPSGNAPDADLPAGTTLTVEVNATNASGSDSATSNTVTPA